MDFSRLKIAIFAAVLLIADLLFLNLKVVITWALIAGTILFFIWQLWWVLSYTILWRWKFITANHASSGRYPSINSY